MKNSIKFITTTLFLSGCGNSVGLEPPAPPLEFEKECSGNAINYDENLGDYYYHRKSYDLAIESYSKAKFNKNSPQLDYKIQKSKYAIAQIKSEKDAGKELMVVIGGCCLGILTGTMIKKMLDK